MSAASTPRGHLVERAMEVMGTDAGLAFMARKASALAPPSSSPPADAAGVLPEATPDAAPPASGPLVSLEDLSRAGLMAAPTGISRSRLWEEIAVVQNQVARTVQATPSTEGRCGRVVLVTSARPGEGKTFTSLNLASAAALGGTRPVLLLDVDGKRGSLSELLGLHEVPGLRTLVADPLKRPSSLVVPTAITGLGILPYGQALPDAPAIPASTVVAAAVLRLTAALPDHLILMDSPPCLSTSDPGTLAAIAGQVLMVVEAERTQRNEVEAALDMVDACPTLQLMLNRTRLTANDTFGAYGGEYGDEHATPGG